MRAGMFLSPLAIAMRIFPPSPAPCPICKLSGGFHNHRGMVIPSELLKESGWHKKED